MIFLRWQCQYLGILFWATSNFFLKILDLDIVLKCQLLTSINFSIIFIDFLSLLLVDRFLLFRNSFFSSIKLCDTLGPSTKSRVPNIKFTMCQNTNNKGYSRWTNFTVALTLLTKYYHPYCSTRTIWTMFYVGDLLHFKYSICRIIPFLLLIVKHFTLK